MQGNGKLNFLVNKQASPVKNVIEVNGKVMESVAHAASIETKLVEEVGV